MAHAAMAANSPAAPALGQRSEKGRELFQSTSPFTHVIKKKRENVSPDLKSELTRSGLDALHDLTLIAIDIRGL